MPDSPHPFPDTSFEAQYKRLLAAAECKTQGELAEVLDISRSSLADAKRREAIPADWLITLLEKKRINPAWVLRGEDAKYLIPADSGQSGLHVVRTIEGRPLEQCTEKELFGEMIRRSVRPEDIEALRKAAADSWQPVDTTDSCSRNY